MNLLCVTGGREFTDSKLVWDKLDVANSHQLVDALVNGGARGVDTFARNWALDRRIDIIDVPAIWDNYGKSAGPRRNRLMARLIAPHISMLVAFPGGVGTANMIANARQLKIAVFEYSEDGDLVNVHNNPESTVRFNVNLKRFK